MILKNKWNINKHTKNHCLYFAPSNASTLSHVSTNFTDCMINAFLLTDCAKISQVTSAESEPNHTFQRCSLADWWNCCLLRAFCISPWCHYYISTTSLCDGWRWLIVQYLTAKLDWTTIESKRRCFKLRCMSSDICCELSFANIRRLVPLSNMTQKNFAILLASKTTSMFVQVPAANSPSYFAKQYHDKTFYPVTHAIQRRLLYGERQHWAIWNILHDTHRFSVANQQRVRLT